MARYLAHRCPKCAGDLWIVLPKRESSLPLRAINGRCAKCGYRLAWIVIRGEIPKQQPSGSNRPTEEQCK